MKEPLDTARDIGQAINSETRNSRLWEQFRLKKSRSGRGFGTRCRALVVCKVEGWVGGCSLCVQHNKDVRRQPALIIALTQGEGSNPIPEARSVLAEAVAVSTRILRQNERLCQEVGWQRVQQLPGQMAHFEVDLKLTEELANSSIGRGYGSLAAKNRRHGDPSADKPA